MGTARYHHTAVLLPTGKVLVAGGYASGVNPATGDGGRGGNPIASAELHDPSTNSWSPAGNMATARAEHTATVLTSGKVLVAGGCCNANGPGLPNDPWGFASAELYDPASNAWSSAGNMPSWMPYPGQPVGVCGHTATLLPSGRVLVAGGYGDCMEIDTAQESQTAIYDPASNAWSPAASMSEPRVEFTAVLLPYGQVLVAGGVVADGVDGYFSSLASAELYDEKTDTWSAASPMFGALADHTATLLPSGAVLVTGGQVYSTGLHWTSTSAGAELFSFRVDHWSLAASMGTARMEHTATLLPSGKVLVAGGLNDCDNTPVSSAELYDPASNSWSPVASMTVPRFQHTATLLKSGQVLVAGGELNGGTTLSTAELYDPVTGRWTPTGSMRAARSGHTATLLLSGKVLVTGGYESGTGPIAAELYDPASNSWSPAGSTSTTGVATLLLSGKVLLAGEAQTINGSNPAAAELYDPTSNSWSPAGNLSEERIDAAATLLASGKVLVAGGWGPIASAELYDPASNSWSPAGNMTSGRQEFTATLLPSGQVLAAGGDDGSSYFATDLYDPVSNNWTPWERMLAERWGHTATLLHTGQILVAGGAASGDACHDSLTSAEVYTP
jgi:hypothetical protein